MSIKKWFQKTILKAQNSPTAYEVMQDTATYCRDILVEKPNTQEIAVLLKVIELLYK